MASRIAPFALTAQVHELIEKVSSRPVPCPGREVTDQADARHRLRS